MIIYLSNFNNKYYINLNIKFIFIILYFKIYKDLFKALVYIIHNMYLYYNYIYIYI